MIELNQVLATNTNYYYSIADIPEINTDNAYIYDLYRLSGSTSVYFEKVGPKMFKVRFNGSNTTYNATVRLQINGIYGYSQWKNTMMGTDNPLKIDITFNITRRITPFILKNTSNSSKQISITYNGATATQDFDMYAAIGLSEDGPYTQYNWARASSTKVFDFTIPAGENLYLYSLTMTSMGHYNGDIDHIDVENAVTDVKFGGALSDIVFEGNIYALTNNNTNSVCLFYGLFRNCSITQAPALPATTINKFAYARMFAGCTSLIEAPALPATIAPDHCYYDMFYACTHMTTPPPILAAQNPDSFAYASMFYGCSALTTAPVLSFRDFIMAEGVCMSMFAGCTSLTTMPELTFNYNPSPAMQTDYHTFAWMFEGCTSLTTLKPILNANGFGAECCYEMFKGCTSITTIPSGMLAIADDSQMDQSCFFGMFSGCTNLTTIPGDLLPARNLSSAPFCYEQMFMNCTSLTTIPTGLLPATTLSRGCYHEMFRGCTSLTTIPRYLLPASRLDRSCYNSMFTDCTSLTTIPQDFLPASTLGYACYRSMFRGCTSLINVPQYLLPAENCTHDCYYAMFKDCTSLVTPPEIRATKAAYESFREMFNGCSSLKSVYCRTTTSLGVADGNTTTTNDLDNTFTDWLNGVSATGTISIKNNAYMNQLPRNSGSGIPSGWTRIYI